MVLTSYIFCGLGRNELTASAGLTPMLPLSDFVLKLRTSFRVPRPSYERPGEAVLLDGFDQSSTG